MSNSGNENTELQDAVKNADVKKIGENLQQNQQDEKPESLSEKEKTPFIDSKDRTDK